VHGGPPRQLRLNVDLVQKAPRQSLIGTFFVNARRDIVGRHMIWKTPNLTLAGLNQRGQGTLVSTLGIEITEIGPDFLRGRMPVDARTIQPIGLLHGGANVALAETLASIAGNCAVDPKTSYIVGQEINANHIRSVRSGWVEGTARALHLGSRSQVWEIKIEQGGKLLCVSRMTAAVLDKATP